MQFSIVQIFGWTLVAGVMATLVRLSEMPIGAVMPTSILVSVFSLIGVSTLWAVLGGETVGARLLLPLGFVVLLLLIAIAFMGDGVRGDAVAYVLVALTSTTGLVAIVLLMFRSAGYRARRSLPANFRRSLRREDPALATSNPWDAADREER
jgi:hypothetical protein